MWQHGPCCEKFTRSTGAAPNMSLASSSQCTQLTQDPVRIFSPNICLQPLHLPSKQWRQAWQMFLLLSVAAPLRGGVTLEPIKQNFNTTQAASKKSVRGPCPLTELEAWVRQLTSTRQRRDGRVAAPDPSVSSQHSAPRHGTQNQVITRGHLAVTAIVTLLLPVLCRVLLSSG